MASSGNPLQHRVQRRAFLRNVVLGFGALPLVAACGSTPAQQAAPTTAPKPSETVKPAAPVATAPPPPAATAQPTQAPAKPAAPVTIKYLSHIWAEKGRDVAWRGLVKKYHSQQNDIRIEEVSFPYSEFFQRVMTQLAGGRLDADVLTCTDELAVRLVKANHLEPVDDLVAKLGIGDKLDKGVHDFVTSGGKLYGILSVLGPYALIYNKELYEKEGIKTPPPPRTSTLPSPSRSPSVPTSSATLVVARCPSRTAGGRTHPVGAGLRWHVVQGQEAARHRSACHQRS